MFRNFISEKKKQKITRFSQKRNKVFQFFLLFYNKFPAILSKAHALNFIASTNVKVGNHL